MNKLKTLRVGIMPFKDFQKYTIDVVSGKRKVIPNQPKLWFNSMKSLANVLSEENQKLLRIIMDEKPQTIYELAPLTGRKANNILRTLRTMENYGLVELIVSKQKSPGRKALIPKVLYDTTNIQIHFG